MNILRQTAAGGGKLLSLAALATIVLGCATSAHADSISIDLDATNVTLQRSGDLYKHTSSLHVRNSNTYGFTLSMNASQPNLVNSNDPTYKIDSVSGTNQHLAANQWGYGMGKNATTFSSVSSATLANITSDSKGDCTSVDDCALYLTLGANIDSKRLPVGNYSTTLTYTVTSKPKPYIPPTPAPDPPSGGGSSYDYWWSVCNDRYHYDSDKRSYCYIHNGDMSGYEPDWSTICSNRYPSDSDKRSYCTSHNGDMSGHQPDWDAICRARYPGHNALDGAKAQYCRRYEGDMSEFPFDWKSACNNKYSTNLEVWRCCYSHHGNMSSCPGA